MSRVRNATEFLRLLHRNRANYEERYRPMIESARSQNAANPSRKAPPEIDECLEAHLRQYFINGFLNALNWRLELSPDEGLPNMIPELPIASLARGTIRYLDYLGSERETNKPLLLVETKRPSSDLPQRRNASFQFEAERVPELICKRLSETSSSVDPVNQTDLGSEWNEWLTTLRDYVRSVCANTGDVPRRAIITNGRWLVLFVDPRDSFLEGGRFSPDSILVYEDAEGDRAVPTQMEERFDELFGLLEHQHVLNRAEPLLASQLPFHVRSDLIDRVMHGLHVKYIEQKGIYEFSPVIQVSPVLFARSRFGAWFQVESQRTDYIPNLTEELPGHLARVAAMASGLLADVNNVLRAQHTPIGLEAHYADTESFKDLPSVFEIGHDKASAASQDFLVVTGSNTHYLLAEPTVPDCPYHDWNQSREAGCEVRSSIEIRSIEPRSFFKSRELHHCSHRLVAAAKGEQITAENRERAGSRSGKDGEAFCEIWRLDEYLCCRTCAFQSVCTKADLFVLPCHLPEPQDDQTSTEPISVSGQFPH